MDFITITAENVTGYNDKLYNYFIDQEFTDTELVLEDGRIKVHSYVLAAASEKLYKMLKAQTELQKTLILTNFNKERMRYILEIIYKGSVFFPRVFENEINQDIKYFELKGINIAKGKLPTDSESESDSICDPVDIILPENLFLSPVIKNRPMAIRNIKKSPIKQNDESDNSLDFLSPQFEANSIAQIFSPTALSKNDESDNSLDFLSPPFEANSIAQIFSPTVLSKNDESDNSPDFLSPQFEANSTAQIFSPTALSKEQNNKSVTDNNCRTPNPSNVNNTLCSSDETMWNDSSADDISDHQTNRVQKVKNPFSPKRRKVLPLIDDEETSDSSKNSKSLRNEVKASSFWTNNKKGWTTKENTLSRNYCTVCNKDINNIKDHIKVIHKKLIRFPVQACEKCGAKHYFKSMKEFHQTLCKNEEQ